MKFYYNVYSAVNATVKGSFFVAYKNVPFPMWCHYKGLKKWVVFFPGASRRNIPPPVFQRSSFSDELNANVLSLFDPSLLFHKNLTNSWFCGTPARYYSEYLAELLRSFFKNIGVDNKDILLFGTSAGGLPAFKSAQNLPGSVVWAGNIQTKAYEHSAFEKMLPILFPNISKDACIELYQERFEAKQMDGPYTVHFFQNKSDVFHYQNHYIPYKKWWNSKKTASDVIFYEYDDPEAGHGSVGRVKEIAIINTILVDSVEGELDLDWAKRDWHEI